MKDEPRIIYSFDSFPIVNNRWNQGDKLKETIYSTALSILYSHLWYEDIELYADEVAYKFLYMLPCRVTEISSNYDAVIWMKSKIDVIEKQTKPFVHIDNDAFIKKKIDFNFDKIIVEQNDFEIYRIYQNPLVFFNQYVQDLPHWDPDLGYAYNCGILGFRDLQLRDQFVNAYYRLEEIFIKNSKTRTEYVHPCVVLEQYNLAALLKHNNIEPTLLLGKKDLYENSQLANQIGYSHIAGAKKYKSDIEQAIEYRLFKLFPYWYRQINIALENERVIESNTLQFI